MLCLDSTSIGWMRSLMYLKVCNQGESFNNRIPIIKSTRLFRQQRGFWSLFMSKKPTQYRFSADSFHIAQMVIKWSFKLTGNKYSSQSFFSLCYLICHWKPVKFQNQRNLYTFFWIIIKMDILVHLRLISTHYVR